MPPDIKPVAPSKREADLAEAEVLRLQKLLNEQQAQALETTRKIQEALKAMPGPVIK